MPITALYASLLALLFVALSVRVIGLRRLSGVALGDGGKADLMRRMRVHANFAEYVPLALVLLGFAESLGTPSPFLHLLGLTLLLGRLLHAFGVSQARETFFFRVSGMALTLGTLLLAAGSCLLWPYFGA